MAAKMFMVTFVHLKGTTWHNRPVPVMAESVAALEPEIQEIVDSVSGEGKTVTVVPDIMRGSVDYGLSGEFTISDGS